MSMMSRQRQLLLEGLQQAEGTVLWGKLRQMQPLDDEPVALKEGGRVRSRARKPRQ
jgi:hypothetical protein